MRDPRPHREFIFVLVDSEDHCISTRDEFQFFNPACFVRHHMSGHLLWSVDLTEARRWRDEENEGIDDGEPMFYLVMYCRSTQFGKVIA